MTLAEIFPDEDYKLQMRFTRGTPAAFFAATPSYAAIVAERQRWLETEPGRHAAILAGGEELMDECAQFAVAETSFVRSEQSPLGCCVELGKFWEVDYLLLKPDAAGELRLFGGCLCFPSHWQLTDKLGQGIDAIHSPVPALNATLGPAITKFLGGLKPGLAWLRGNWGLSRTPEFNQHPDRQLPRLDASVKCQEVWVRVEEQALLLLPESRGVLFGIRIVNHPLEAVIADAGLRRNFARALRTLPAPLADYKGISPARERLLSLLG